MKINALARAHRQRMDAHGRFTLAIPRQNGPPCLDQTYPGSSCRESEPTIRAEQVELTKTLPQFGLPGTHPGGASPKPPGSIQTGADFINRRGKCPTIADRPRRPEFELFVPCGGRRFRLGRQGQAGGRATSYGGTAEQLSSRNPSNPNSAKNSKSHPAIPRSVKNKKLLPIQ